MNERERKHPSLFTCVALDAMIAAHCNRLTFTVNGFCERFGYTPNRHVREALNTAAREGWLFKQKRLFSDGHYRMQYSASPPPFPGFEQQVTANSHRLRRAR
jgi:hypothetical protein